MTKFIVQKAPEEDIGRDRIRIHYSHRNGAKRFAIMRVTSPRHSAILCVLGLDKDQSVVQMDIDLRAAFEVEPDQEIELTLERAGWFGKIRWYLFATDPAVHVPAWIGAWSFVLGLVGLILSAVPLFS